MALAYMSMEYAHTHWGPGMSALEPFAEALLTRITDGTIGTVEGMEWFRPAIAKAMKKTSATKYTSAHCYRSLLDVLGMSVPGDAFFIMGTGSDNKAYSVYTSRRNLGIIGLSSFNKCAYVHRHAWYACLSHLRCCRLQVDGEPNRDILCAISRRWSTLVLPLYDRQ